MSTKAKWAIGQKVRAWHLNRRSGTDTSGPAEKVNPQVRGWINYYGAFYRFELRLLAWRINEHIVRWAMQKFKTIQEKYGQDVRVAGGVASAPACILAHWQLCQPTGSRSMGPGDGRPHVRF